MKTRLWQRRRLTPGQSVVCVLLIVLAFRIGHSSALQAEPRKTYAAKVERVIDGDTVDLSDGTRVRLLGINAPEIAHHGKSGEPYGNESTDWLRQQVEGKMVTIAEGIENLDRYNRRLAWIYFADGRLISQMSLRQGQARLEDRFGLPYDLEDDLRAAETHARKHHLGLWAKKRPPNRSTTTNKK